MGRIQQLDPLLVNQIAAGEVVERPASVLKETLENALDAGSSKITVRLSAGGKSLIEITDNGDGILREDLGLAISTHATSKITSMQDLTHIASLGFRGEALASIASVSKFTLISKPKDQQQAYKLYVEGKDSAIEESPEAHPKGTTIQVSELFFNVPVRQTFLKQDKTEYLYCEDIFKKIAMAHPQVSFELKEDADTKHYYPAQFGDDAYQQRAFKVLGKKFMDNAHALNVLEHDIHIHGLVANPDYSRSQSDQQFIFLNGRPIKDKLIHHAIRQAYEDQISPGRYPAFVIYIDMDPTQVDVNVHPQKTEVRFQSPRIIHDLLISRISAIWHGKRSPARQTTESSLPYTSPQHVNVQSGTTQPDSALQQLAMQSTSLDQHAVIIQTNDMFIVDYQRFYHAYFKDELAAMETFQSEPLLFPARGTVLGQQMHLIKTHQDLFHTFGLEIDQISEHDVLLRAAPKLPFKIDEKACLEFIVDHISSLTADVIRRSLLQALKLTPQLKSEQQVVTLLTSHPNLPCIRIDLNAFEVMT